MNDIENICIYIYEICIYKEKFNCKDTIAIVYKL